MRVEYDYGLSPRDEDFEEWLLYNLRNTHYQDASLELEQNLRKLQDLVAVIAAKVVEDHPELLPEVARAVRCECNNHKLKEDYSS